MDFTRRNIFALSAAAVATGVTTKLASAQAMPFQPNARYPDPAVQILDPSFAKYRISSSTLEQVATGARCLEGPVWFGDGRYLLVSDIPNNRIMKYDEANETWSVFRDNANYTNGHTRDKQGRLVSCEHLTRRVTRTEYDGSITVLANNFNGKKLNSPNDIICKSDGSLWFTDPPFGIGGEWEGEKATPELPHSVYRISPEGKLDLVTDQLKGPNGLAFSPDEKKLYIVEGRAAPHRIIWLRLMTMAALMASRSISTATSGAAGEPMVRPVQSRKTLMASRSSTLKARRSASSSCRNVARTSSLAVQRRTVFTWRAATRSMHSTSRPAALSDSTPAH